MMVYFQNWRSYEPFRWLYTMPDARDLRIKGRISNHQQTQVYMYTIRNSLFSSQQI